MKKVLQICLFAFAFAILTTVSAHAAEIVDSGFCGAEGDGSNLTWTLDSEGTLRIEGTGAMGYHRFIWDKRPW